MKSTDLLSMNRRQFAKGALGIAALAATAGVFGTVTREAAAEAAEKIVSCDVLIVGAGAAGVTAAYTAASAGAQTIVLEKLDSQRGSSLLAGGTLYGAGTKLQEADGIEDDAEGLLDYFLMRGGDKLDPQIQQLCSVEYGKTIDWLSEEMGVLFAPTIEIRGIDTVKRAHRIVAEELNSDGSYKYVASPALEIMTNAALEAGADLQLNVKVESLIVEDDAVVGVLATDAEGEQVRYDAKTTVMACGGFCQNQDMMQKYLPDYAGVLTEVGQGCTGEGLEMGLEIGAAYIGHGGTNGNLWCEVEPGQSKFSSKDSVWLTSAGERFINEGCQPHDAYYTVATLPDQQYFCIYDQAIVDGLSESLSVKFERAMDEGLFTTGQTVAEAAEAQGLPGEAFQTAFDAYNELVETGEDTQFGKDPERLIPLTQPPFYVLKNRVATHGSFGGYEVDTQMRVLDESGSPIPGFYAAGEVSCGTFIYDDYPAGGCGLNWAYTTGRLVGTIAAEEALGA